MLTPTAQAFCSFLPLLYPDRAARLQVLDGVCLETPKSLAAEMPLADRWNPSPAGYSKRPAELISWMSLQRLAIYSSVGNTVIKHPSCHRMVDDLLRALESDDVVVIVDARYATGAAVLAGQHDASTPPELLDRPNYRQANSIDVEHIYSTVVFPTWLRRKA